MQNKGFPEGLASLEEAPRRGEAGDAGALVLLPHQPLPPTQGMNIGTTLMAAPRFVPTERLPLCLFLLLISGGVHLILLPSHPQGLHGPAAPGLCSRPVTSCSGVTVSASPHMLPRFPGWCRDTGQSLVSTGLFMVLAEEKEQQDRAR